MFDKNFYHFFTGIEKVELKYQYTLVEFLKEFYWNNGGLFYLLARGEYLKEGKNVNGFA